MEIDNLFFFLHNLTVMDHPDTHARYLPVEKEALRWGLHVIDCGFSDCPPHTPYPPWPMSHPPAYLFSWEQGRILKEFQVIYISRGRGSFESETTGLVQVREGSVLLLVPGVWHRYRPVAATGWTECWIGFGGDYAERIMKQFFPLHGGVIRAGVDEGLFMQIRSMNQLLQDAPPGHQQLLAARTIEILARIRSLEMGLSESRRRMTGALQEARRFLSVHSREEVDMTALARQLGLSYSRFRTMFRQNTGMAPGQYLIHIRINRAVELLTDTELGIGEIAGQLGFSSVYYFSRLFKQKTGMAPLAFRRKGKSRPGRSGKKKTRES